MQKTARPKLSISIITLNEAHNIEYCLQSVAGWADEIVIVDSGSDDGTVEIAEELGAKVYKRDWPGYGIQKNRAIELTNGEWILSIDADERVPGELKEEIDKILCRPKYDAYSVKRLSSFCGRFMHHSGWWPDRVTRLFRKGAAKFNNVIVHEKLEAAGPIGKTNGHLVHYTYRNLHDAIEKMNKYSSASALQKGKHGSIAKAITHGIWMFLRTYFLKAGFLDGKEGFLLSVLNAETSYYKYVKPYYTKNGAKS
jgi:glycosyltransferase involved in cell wall biosynthesis